MIKMGSGVIFLILVICTLSRSTYGCQLEGINPVLVLITVDIKDVDRGDIYNRSTVDIRDIIGVTQNDGLSTVSYITGRISDSTFYLETTPLFAQYEENETSQTINILVNFRCNDGSDITQVFEIHVQDTNNNSPEFIPSDVFEFTIAPPLLPGYQITGCQNNIIVRDIDLTTSGIDFKLTGSDLFEISLDSNAITAPKTFEAMLRTTTFIRTLPDPIEIVISATDIDSTDDPPRTTTATVRIKADPDAVLPEEPVFNEPLYIAEYTKDNEINLEKPITLRQGYHEDVEFSLDDEYKTYFGLNTNGNEITLTVLSPLSEEVLWSQQLYLIIRADREFTSGSTTTVIVRLPEEILLTFERSYYEGTIQDNTLHLSDLLLSQGYENRAVSANVSNEFFTAEVTENRVKLLMHPLTDNVIEENTFLNLDVVASTDRSSTSTVVTLEIIKNDTVTPVFDNTLYVGTYDIDNGLTIDEIVLTQGYDETVEVTLNGEYSTYFKLIRAGPSSTLTVENLPSELFYLRNLAFTIEATKPRTVGATAVIDILLPEVVAIEFEHSYYEGHIEHNELELTDLILIQGYEDQTISLDVSNDNFEATIHENRIILTMQPLTESVIEKNWFINFVVTASTASSSATTVVILEIVKNDTITPVFEKALYDGSYDLDEGLTIDPITLVQGYDETVNVYLDGDYADLFHLERNGPLSTLTVDSIAPEIFNKQHLTLVVLASKPRTVGATAVINIDLPSASVLEFEAPSYLGTYENGILNIDSITLKVGYDENVVFSIDVSEYKDNFGISNDGNVVTISLSEPLPENVVHENNFLLLTLKATGVHALNTTTSILIEIIKADTVTPVFSQYIYEGLYSEGEIVIPNIDLIQGFDSTVSFRLDGDHSQYFDFKIIENGVELLQVASIPEDVIFSEKNLLFNVIAEKPLTVGANAVINIEFPPELTDFTEMKFTRNTYIGTLEEGKLALEDITLETGYIEGTKFFLTGEYSSYFNYINTNGIVSISLSNTITPEIITENKFIVLEIEAQRDRAVSVSSTIIIDLVQPQIVLPVFSNAFYKGSYDLEIGLEINERIFLMQGYDDTVEFKLEGEFSELFSVSDNNNVIELSTSGIPENVWSSTDLLLFTIIANKPEMTSGRAAIAIHLNKELIESAVLRFERTNYLGSVTNGTINLEPITLTQGYTAEVEFTLQGDLRDYFSWSNDESTVIIQLREPIPEESIPSNRIIILELQASTADALSASATIILEMILDDDGSPGSSTELVFSQAYYVGTYTLSGSLLFEDSISLSEGYDDSVTFDIEGEHASYFELVRDGNSVTLKTTTPIPPAVTANNNQLILVVIAQKTGSPIAQATVVIDMPDEFTQNAVLGFERTNYLGSVIDDTVNLEPITLTEGYTADVVFTLQGDLQDYFSWSNDESTVSIQLQNPIPEESIPSNRIIILELRASTADALPASATIILEMILDDDGSPGSSTELVFSQAFYVGTYTLSGGLSFEDSISLSEGYDDSVTFDIEGEYASYFELVRDGNSVTLKTTTPIPPAVTANNNQLILVVIAQKTGSPIAQATVVIDMPDEFTQNAVLGFERTNYLGSVIDDTVNLEPITLTEGYTADVVFTLQGDLQDYFSWSNDESTVSIQLQNPIPEESIPSNRIIILELRASTADALPASATIILEMILDDDGSPGSSTELVFSQAYYVGTYTLSGGLSFEDSISLSEGYDDSVTFDIEGEYASYFELVRDGNSVTLKTTTPIPPAVTANNNQLILVVIAQKTGSPIAQATVVIDMPDEFTQNAVLGFERTNYLGSVIDDTVNLEPITLTEGYTADVVFTLQGDLRDYFSWSNVESTVSIQLQNPIPEESIPSNRIIILELRASTADALPASATIILEMILDDDGSPGSSTELVFSQAFYVGTYTLSGGLSFEDSISLSEGYDDSVTFDIEGEYASYFELVRDGNSVTLKTTTPIPPAVTANNNQLILVVIAQKTGSPIAQATVVIDMPDEFTQNAVLGFERTNYLGSVIDDTVNLEPITLTEGYTADVVFTLQGDLRDYFSWSNVESTVSIQLQNPIPEESIPSNRIIILELRASTADALPASATIILEMILDDDGSPGSSTELVFSQAYYLGTYTLSGGLSFEDSISLTEGYDDSVTFDIEGEHASYFELVRDGNSVTLKTTTPIPPAVTANNNQLILVVIAQKTGSPIAQATVVIDMPDEFTQNAVLGFERTNYLGSVIDDTVNLEPITLTEGYTADVVFTLQGDLQDYFSWSNDESTVSIQLQNPIPEESIPSNRIIILELRASTADALPASATIILEMILDDDGSPGSSTELVFSQAYYLGTYTLSGGLSFEDSISLSEGYDDSVTFDIEGEHASYFELVRDGNSVTLKTTTPIPPAVTANNNQLILVVIAQKTGSPIAQATVVLDMPDEFTQNAVLGFERTNYLGSVIDDTVNLEPITLTEGYTADVVFTLQGDLRDYFSWSNVESTVSIQLQNPIPEESIPSNRIIILELRASTADALPASATIILEMILDDDGSPGSSTELVFSQAYYLGTYTLSGGLSFEDSISLSEGYDDSVTFDIEGEHASYFELVRDGNSVTLKTTTPIPPAVTANNNQLILVVIAQKTGSPIAQATVVIDMPDEFTQNAVLGFERTNYLGSVIDDTVNLEPITLTEGYTADVVFTLQGDLRDYFSWSNDESTVSIQLQNAIPEESIPSNRIIILELRASTADALPASATIILEMILDDDGSPGSSTELVFSQAYYVGTYTLSGGLSFEDSISLSEGYDDSVTFDIEGEYASYFELVRDGNSVTLKTTTPIPPAVTANNNQLILVVIAQKTGSPIAQATVVIDMADEFTQNAVLGFERTNYLGSVIDDTVNLEPITLTEGYTADVVFTLQGDLRDYFSWSNVESTVSIQLQKPIPEESIPSNRIIILELRASTADALPASATIILEMILDDDGSPGSSTELVFSQAFYVGTYTLSGGLSFEDSISLSEGYDDSVTFDIEGEHASYFELVRDGNSVTLKTTTPIPPAVTANNNQLILVVIAQKTGSPIAQATVVIDMPDEFTQNAVLGFERTNYLGSVIDDTVNLEPITLTEGYTADVVFTLQGDLRDYFSWSNDESTVSIQLQNAIPEESIPSNRIIILELRASTADALPASATIILEMILDDDGSPGSSTELVFSQAFYVGTYTLSGGLLFEDSISLSEGYDDSVTFDIEGEYASYFELVRDGNSVTLKTTTPIPPAVTANNNQLILVVIAQKTGSPIAQATVVIDMPDEFTQNAVLGFERTNYLGSVIDDTVNLEPITLTEGYTADVVFTLQGDLRDYFSWSNVESTVSIQLQNPIPEESIPSNRIIILELRASTADALPASATIILEMILDDDSSPGSSTELVFSQAYYLGTYTLSGGLSFEDSISLSEGYDDSVTFDIEGEHASYFELVRDGNSVTLKTTTPIPPAVTANNNQLILVVIAQKTGSPIAQATVVIDMPDEFTQNAVLGFERTNYLGSVIDDTVNLEPITLTEGYTADVVFTLQGDLRDYFSWSNDESTVSIQLQKPIPEESIPSNRIIILELRASTADALPASATIILEMILDDDGSPGSSTELVFSQAYYLGTYTLSGGLSFEDSISLTEGYDDSVTFDIEGEYASYFELVRDGNSVTLKTTTPIPPAVTANNNQLILVVIAQKTGSPIAQATVVIDMPDEFTQNAVLGFERTNYLGSVIDDTVNLEPITLTEGYTADVVFTLQGDLRDYFSWSNVESTVSIQLQNPIPEESIPSNRIIILELRASTADALPASATIILEMILDDDSSPGSSTELVFSQAYYLGTYTLSGGLSFEDSISLSEGYDDSVTFDIEGEHASYFELVRDGNSVTLKTTTPIPPAVTANNNHLILVVIAQKTGSPIAQATVVVDMPDDFPSSLPTVMFTPSSYVLRAEMLQTGTIGRVAASSSNGETVTYSLVVDDDHLRERISVNDDGDLILSTPVNSGDYVFQVVATTINTEAIGTAPVYLSVRFIENLDLPPLIIVEGDEEEPHSNLVTFNSTNSPECSYSLLNRWPTNQNWLYLDGNNLHTRAIDREDPSIAYMPLSQIQVEIVFQCNNDIMRSKRSIDNESRLNWLGPYDYGTKKWILTDSISHNSARSIVNLIVNDINDNPPVFVGSEKQQIVVGYPVPEIKNLVLPRALVELKATDADIGDNAALVYWSSETDIAVSSASGFVHVSDHATLEDDQILTVNVTDLDGNGHTSSIKILVKLLQLSNIAVVTVRDAFLEDEQNILTNISNIVGYEIKVLRSVVISDTNETDAQSSRITRAIIESSGATLELYVYGLVQQEPVTVDRLTEDINNAEITSVRIASTTALEYHLEGRMIYINSGRDVGLLAATIILSILLVILIVTVIAWYFLKWRKDGEYTEFGEQDSLESRNESVGVIPKEESRPRIDLEDLKRSERRLQEMIDAPFKETAAVPSSSTYQTATNPFESIIDMTQPDTTIPIVINDKLNDANVEPDADGLDETHSPRRKSVVTFNENVEKIIHVEDINAHPETEVYKL